MEISLSDWKSFLAKHPNAHILQTGEWGELKSKFGWEAVRIVSGETGAQILFRHLPLGWALGYIPKGPVFSIAYPDINSQFWDEVDDACRSRRAVFLKMEFDQWEDNTPGQFPGAIRPGDYALRESPHSIQPRRTIVLDLTGSENEILGRMKQKCRYNIRLAEKKGVTVRPWEDLNGFHRMLTITGERNEFGVHSPQYYRRVCELFHPLQTCALFVAEFEGQPLAALMVMVRGKRAWYMYGASTDEERNRMPAYLLQWEAMRWAKTQGAETYDLWGIPDESEEVLEANFESRQEGLWGVYRFKRGFGGQVLRTVPPLDRVYQPMLYRAYLWRMGSERTGLGI